MVSEAVRSVLEQTFGDLEVIVVDDGSTDGTREALKPHADKIRYLRQENSGVSAARNRGIAEARGSLIAFLDSDDLWLPAKLKTQVLFFEAFPRSRVCHTDEIWIRHGKWVNQRLHHRRLGGWIFEDLCRMSLISPSSVVLRRDLLEEVGGFDESLPAGEDFDLWLRISPVARIDYITRPLLIKRGGHDDQLSRSIWGLDRFRVAALQKALDSGGLTKEQRRAARESLEAKCRVIAGGSTKRGRPEDAARYLDIIQEYSEDDHEE